MFTLYDYIKFTIIAYFNTDGEIFAGCYEHSKIENGSRDFTFITYNPVKDTEYHYFVMYFGESSQLVIIKSKENCEDGSIIEEHLINL